jgi:hypothetical protein
MKSILTLAALTGAFATAPVFTIGQEPDAALVARAVAGQFAELFDRATSSPAVRP